MRATWWKLQWLTAIGLLALAIAAGAAWIGPGF
jgi:hypothetical protein